MNTKGKALLTALTAAIVLALTAGTASANRSISIEAAQLITGTSPRVEFNERGGTVNCAVTLRGSLHPLIAKVVGQLAGYITEGRTERCTETVFGSRAIAIPLVEHGTDPARPPWHVRYASFGGTLPNINFVLVIVLRARFLVGTIANECLYEGDIEAEGSGAAFNEIERIRIERVRNIARLLTVLAEPLRPCEPTGTLRGTFTVRPRIRLILR